MELKFNKLKTPKASIEIEAMGVEAIWVGSHERSISWSDGEASLKASRSLIESRYIIDSSFAPRTRVVSHSIPINCFNEFIGSIDHVIFNIRAEEENECESPQCFSAFPLDIDRSCWGNGRNYGNSTARKCENGKTK